MPSSMHICASQTEWVMATTTYTPPQLSKHLFLHPSSSTPTTVTGTPYSYNSTHRTPYVYVPISNVRHNYLDRMDSTEDPKEASESTSAFQATTTTQTSTQAHDQSSVTTAPQPDPYALPPPDTYPRFVFKTQNVDYTNEDTTDTESISDVGHHWHLPPPRIYFPESLITYVPPYCSDMLARDPDVKGIPRNYRSWTRAGRPRLEVDGATRNDAKSDFNSIGLVWRGSGNGDGDSESDISDGKGDDKDKRRRKKKKLGARKSAAPAVPIERPKRMVRRIAEADGQLRIVPGIVTAPVLAVGGAPEKAERFDGSRAQSLTHSLPNSRAQSPLKRRKIKANDLDAGAERKTEADAEVEDEKDADGSEDDVDADGEVDPDAIILQGEKAPVKEREEMHKNVITAMRAAGEVPGSNMTNQALSESSSVTLIDLDSPDGDGQHSKDVDKAILKAAKQVSTSIKPAHNTKKRKCLSKSEGIEKEEEVNNDNVANVPSPKKSRLSRSIEIKAQRSEVKENETFTDGFHLAPRTTRSTSTATPQTKQRNFPTRGTAVKPEKTILEPVHLPLIATISDQEGEEDQESATDDGDDETFTPGKQTGIRPSGWKSSRTPKTRSKLPTTVPGVEGLNPPSSRPTRATRAKQRGSSPSALFDVANSSGSESKSNAGLNSIPISRPHHRTTQPMQPAISIPTRTFDPPIPIIEGYAGFYRRYPLILQFDTSGGATEAGSPVKKPNSFGDLENIIMTNVPSELVTNPKRPLGNFNPPRDIRDLYTPRYTKGSGGKKLALCPICFEDPRRGGEGRQEWNHTKTSQHNYHMQYYHGISASRFQPFSPPIAHRIAHVVRPQSNEKSEILQGKCHHCKQWIALEGLKVGELKVKELFWWKHAAGCHKDSNLPGEKDIFIEDEAYRSLLQYESEHGIDSEIEKQIVSPNSTA